MRLLCFVVALGAALAPALASADRIDAYVLAELKRQHIPGAWVVVRKDGKVVKRKGYGWANLEDRTVATPETLMQTGSIGKMFTATGVTMLVQEGKLSLTDSIAKYFPGSPDWWKPITIHDLLTHTGGIPDYEGRESVNLKKEYSEDDLIKYAQGLKPEFAPGEKWSYSNTDYVILGVLIHRLTGQFYGDFLRDRVWRPNRLPTMRVINDREVIPHRASGYDWENGHWLNQDWVSASLNSTADGALYATADDFIAWDEALDAGKVLPKDLQETMWTSSRLKDGSTTGYGYAWQVGDTLGHRYVGHSGAWQGFTSGYLRYRDDRLSVAVFANCSGGNPMAMASGVARLYGRIPIKESLKPIVGDSTDLNAARRIVTEALQGRQPTERVGGGLLDLSREFLEGEKASGTKLGPLKEFVLVYRESSKDGYSVYRAIFQNRVVWFKLTQNDAGLFTSARAMQP